MPANTLRIQSQKLQAGSPKEKKSLSKLVYRQMLLELQKQTSTCPRFLRLSETRDFGSSLSSGPPLLSEHRVLHSTNQPLLLTLGSRTYSGFTSSHIDLLALTNSVSMCGTELLPKLSSSIFQLLSQPCSSSQSPESWLTGEISRGRCILSPFWSSSSSATGSLWLIQAALQYTQSL